MRATRSYPFSIPNCHKSNAPFTLGAATPGNVATQTLWSSHRLSRATPLCIVDDLPPVMPSFIRRVCFLYYAFGKKKLDIA